eukprot:5693430-Alexandrium_andersonii.AAC.1
MSASLVGSEMCIRDSRESWLACECTVRQHQHVASRRAFCEFVERTASPVSYTHLTLPTICSV